MKDERKMSFTLVVELALTGLLAATLGYCVVLERKLSQLRSGQDGLKDTIAELNAAVTGAGAAMRALKSAASETTAQMDEKLSRSRGLVDELSVLCASGERIAQRIERNGTPQQTAARSTPTPRPAPARAGNLEALRAVR
jgi:ABC-type transporter Mla subunit MlaD